MLLTRLDASKVLLGELSSGPINFRRGLLNGYPHFVVSASLICGVGRLLEGTLPTSDVRVPRPKAAMSAPTPRPVSQNGPRGTLIGWTATAPGPMTGAWPGAEETPRGECGPLQKYATCRSRVQASWGEVGAHALVCPQRANFELLFLFPPPF